MIVNLRQKIDKDKTSAFSDIGIKNRSDVDKLIRI